MCSDLFGEKPGAWGAEGFPERGQNTMLCDELGKNVV